MRVEHASLHIKQRAARGGPLSKMDMRPCTSSRGLQMGRPCSVLQTKAPLEQAILPRCHGRQLAKVIYNVPVISNQQDWVVIVERQLG